MYRIMESQNVGTHLEMWVLRPQRKNAPPPTAILSQLGKIQERETLLIPSAVLIYSDWTTLDQKSQEPT